MIPEIRKILYTTDLSPNARFAFSYAASLANRYEDGGYQSGTQHAIGDTGFKKGFPSIGLIDLCWILITGDTHIQVSI